LNFGSAWNSFGNGHLVARPETVLLGNFPFQADGLLFVVDSHLALFQGSVPLISPFFRGLSPRAERAQTASGASSNQRFAQWINRKKAGLVICGAIATSVSWWSLVRLYAADSTRALGSGQIEPSEQGVSVEQGEVPEQGRGPEWRDVAARQRDPIFVE